MIAHPLVHRASELRVENRLWQIVSCDGLAVNCQPADVGTGPPSAENGPATSANSRAIAPSITLDSARSTRIILQTGWASHIDTIDSTLPRAEIYGIYGRVPEMVDRHVCVWAVCRRRPKFLWSDRGARGASESVSRGEPAPNSGLS